MKNIKHMVMISILVLTSLLGCAGVQSKSVHLQEGMHVNSVIDTLGTPIDKTVYEGGYVYQWCSSGEGGGWNGHVAIMFVNHKLVATQTYRSVPPSCYLGLKTPTEIFK